MHIPKDSITTQTIVTRRVAIQGPPKSGKTTAALTAPNIIVADFDNNMPIASTVPKIPFWNPKWIEEYSKANRINVNKPTEAPNRRDVFKHWLRANIDKFTAEQTLVIDSWSMLQNAFDQQTDLQPVITSKGEIDKFAFWKQKIQYSIEIMEMLKAASCNVIVIFHETIERDDKGLPTGKIEPLMQGQFKDQLKGHFTDWFRQSAMAVKDNEGRVKQIDYVWQIKPSAIADCACSVLGLKETFVPADWPKLFGQALSGQKPQ